MGVCACMHMCMCSHVCICVYVTVLIWRSKDNFWDSFFFMFTVWSSMIEIRFHSVLVGRAYLMSYLSGPRFCS